LFQYLYIDLVQGLPPSKVSHPAEESLQAPGLEPSLALADKSSDALGTTPDSPGDESDLTPDPLANVKLYFMDENGAVTLVSLDNIKPACQLPAYPVKGGSPSFINYWGFNETGPVVACGSHYLEASTQCFAYEGIYSDSPWIQLPNSTLNHCIFDTSGLLTTQYDSSGLMTGMGWWLSGRTLDDNDDCSSYKWASEVFNGFEWVAGPDPPKGVTFIDSCTVQVNTTHSLVVGGMASISQSWLYDWQAGRWTEAGQLNRPRFYHSCVAVEGLGVLVVGGADSTSNSEFTVELFDSDNGTWSLQPSLPNFMDTYHITVLQWQGTVIALANQDDRVFKREDDGSWGVLEGVLLPQMFKGGQHKHAVIVHDDYGLGCL